MAGLIHLVIDMDRSLFNAINSLANRSGVLDWLARLGADDHIVPLALSLLVLLVVVIAKNHQEREDALTCLLCVLAAVAVSTVMVYAFNMSFFRPKPFSSNQVTMLFYHNTDSAFPSNAAALSFAMSFAVFFYNRRVASLMILLSACFGIARIMVGVHYPLDIVSGILVGLSSAFLAESLKPLYQALSIRINLLVDRLLGSYGSGRAFKPGGGGC